jgi:hypothetical protein
VHRYNDIFREGNYKLTLITEVDQLLAKEMDLQERIKEIDILLESYVVQVGKVPDSEQLSRLADFILAEDLRCNHPDKVSRTDFPILSKGQLKLRYKRERPFDMSQNVYVERRKNGKRKIKM